MPGGAQPSRVLGIMSGTSMDGVDYALCRIAANLQVELLHGWQKKFPARLKERLNRAASDRCNSYELAQLHHDLGRFYAAGAAGQKSYLQKVDLVGLHGQTIFHNPSRQNPATLQIGEPAYLADLLKKPVVGNFRAADMAAGGQGAPLATKFHEMVFGRRGAHVCFNNLGGISNVTSLDWTGPRQRILAFDTGPGNILINLAIKHFTRGRLEFDRDGHYASRGQAIRPLLLEWLAHPYFRKKPPKSTGREEFGEEFLKKVLQSAAKLKRPPQDVIATLTALTSVSLAEAYYFNLPSPPDQVILGGGGASNPVLVASIKELLARFFPEAKVRLCSELGWPEQMIEPAAFALLAYLRWRGMPGNVPESTGARSAVLLGQIAAGAAGG